MEVLQTSALPLGDGAGRNWGSKLTWNGPAASRDADDSDERRTWRLSTQTILQREDSTERRARCAPLTVARGASKRRSAGVAERAGAAKGRVFQSVARRTERPTKRPRSEARRRAHRARRFKIGAGNGIRTRDFDLGKVALYH